MTIFSSLVDLATLCERGRAGIVNTEVRFERSRHNTTVECNIVIERSSNYDPSSAGFMMRLVRAVEDEVAQLDHINVNYNGYDEIAREVRFFTDQSTYEWINAEAAVRRSRRDRFGRTRTDDSYFRREILGQPVPPPQLTPQGQRTLERLQQEYSRIPPRSPGSRQIPDSRLSFDRATISVDTAAPTDQAAIVVAEYGQTLTVNKIEIRVNPSVSPNEIQIKQSKDYGNKIIKCSIGDLNSHKWVDVPAEGPTARRCSECKRVTGTFWTPDDHKRFIEWLVTNTKILVLLWARDLDATELRFALLETDSNRKTTEEPTTDDDAVIRFGLLDLK